MSAVSRVSAAGIAIAQWAVLSAEGYPYGTAGVLTNGSQAGMGVFTAIKQASPSNPEARREDATGNDGAFRHTYNFAPEQLPEVEFLFAVFDAEAYAQLLGLKKFVEGPLSGVLLNTNRAVDAVQACLIVSGSAKSADSDTAGLKRYRNLVYPILNMEYLGDNWEEATVAGFRFKGYTAQASKFPWGEAFSVATHGATRAAGMVLWSRYPLSMGVLVGNNTATTINLNYTPAGHQTDGYVKVWVDGVAATNGAYTVSTSGKTVVFTTPPSTGAVTVVRYEATDLIASN